jgi:hypothetical protein
VSADETEREGREGTREPSPAPYVGAPVRAAPVDKATPLQTRVEVSQDPVIALAGTQILRPFDPMWDHFRQDQVKFRVSVKAAAIRVGVTIQKSGGAQLSKDQFTRKEICEAGDHDYFWDGYDDAKLLDTTVLRQGPFYANVYADDGQNMRVGRRIELAAAPALAKWADTKIDLAAKTIAITTYVRFSNDLVRGISDANYDTVKGLIKEGIAQYWKGTIGVNHMPWTVATTVVERDSDSVPFAIQKTAPGWITWTGAGKRCFNMGTLVPGGPIVFYVDESKRLNTAYIRETGAHEFGHSILRDAVDGTTSATHKGTSSRLGSLNASMPYYPMTGEIDLMKYYEDWPAGTPNTNNGYPSDYYSRVVAVEEDLKRFASVARVELSAP